MTIVWIMSYCFVFLFGCVLTYLIVTDAQNKFLDRLSVLKEEEAAKKEEPLEVIGHKTIDGTPIPIIG